MPILVLKKSREKTLKKLRIGLVNIVSKFRSKILKIVDHSGFEKLSLFPKIDKKLQAVKD